MRDVECRGTIILGDACCVCEKRKKELGLSVAYTHELLQVLRLAVWAHQGQTRWNGDPYVTHPVRVAEMVRGKGEKIVALLHDVLEDTNLTKRDLQFEGISVKYIEFIDYLTKEKNESYLNYIIRVKEDRIAIKVKLADLKDNLRDIKDGSLKDKYMLTQYILEN